MAAQLTQLMDALATVKVTLDAGNLDQEMFSQVMNIIVESTGTALNIIKTLFDVHEAKAGETMQQVNLLNNTASLQGVMLQSHQTELADMKQRVVNAPQTQAPRHSVHLTAKQWQT